MDWVPLCFLQLCFNDCVSTCWPSGIHFMSSYLLTVTGPLWRKERKALFLKVVSHCAKFLKTSLYWSNTHFLLRSVNACLCQCHCCRSPDMHSHVVLETQLQMFPSAGLLSNQPSLLATNMESTNHWQHGSCEVDGLTAGRAGRLYYIKILLYLRVYSMFLWLQ